MRFEDIARATMRNAYVKHGRCTIVCECGQHETVIDHDSLDCESDVIRVMHLIDHARYEHMTPRFLLAVREPEPFFDTATIEHVDTTYAHTGFECGAL